MLKALRDWNHRRLRTRNRRRFALGFYQEALSRIETWVPLDTEESNFYYRLSPLNRRHLVSTVACVTGEPFETIERYVREIEEDQDLHRHFESRLQGRQIKVDYGRRLGWYAFARVLKPRVVVETGVDLGVGSCVLCSALLRNRAEGFPGRHYGTDIDPTAGMLLDEPYREVGQVLYGDSIESLGKLADRIDLFINDSDHSADYEYREYLAVRGKLAENALILGDNSHISESLCRFSEETSRPFLFFAEKPADHWYPGAGIGISPRTLPIRGIDAMRENPCGA